MGRLLPTWSHRMPDEPTGFELAARNFLLQLVHNTENERQLKLHDERK